MSCQYIHYNFRLEIRYNTLKVTPLNLSLTRLLFQSGIFISPVLVLMCNFTYPLHVSREFGTSGCLSGTSQAGMPSLTHKTCFQNSGAISSYVGLAAEVGTGNIWIIAIPSNTILSTSLTVLDTVSGFGKTFRFF